MKKIEVYVVDDGCVVAVVVDCSSGVVVVGSCVVGSCVVGCFAVGWNWSAYGFVARAFGVVVPATVRLSFVGGEVAA